jgi:hypothetical protein
MGMSDRLDPATLMELFQRLPDDDKGAVIHLAQHLARKIDPVRWSMDLAPADDEPLSAAELDAIEHSRREGGRITLDELEAELDA